MINMYMNSSLIFYLFMLFFQWYIVAVASISLKN